MDTQLALEKQSMSKQELIQQNRFEQLINIMIMYKSCVDGMIRSGITQWDATYPNKEIIARDIHSETYFIAIDENKIIGGVNIDVIKIIFI